ncbi:Bug family tripartite tricarboxylate transporter substrate binding protein [Lampropedia aestuarii]|uniref:Bug family tripartite tricarboxylate transporter substrate binding protein n=1 Tax=Lampropedia aestuarii TaxID=2562762 RepID=UPI002469BAC0|nr:tripartite tricarboxylate transporter substrate binding protein [Lampropedia aestuarii]MDH5855928.1 tripartite tricarboxylate transporter substrate binding protein [Lampropedia aestuarii]
MKKLVYSVVFLLGAMQMASAQTYPEKPITLVIPYTPAGITDNSGRLAAKKLSERLGQPIVIENRPGAGGAVGAEYAARAKPDGYTIFQGTRGTQVTNAMILKDVKIPAAADFASVYGFIDAATVIVVRDDAPFQTLEELVAYAKQNPGKVNYATAGNGSGAHLTGELFQDVAGIQMTHVPYRGSAPAVQDLLGGSVSVAFDYPATTASFIKSGRLRALAVVYGERISSLPDVPTASEAGVAGAESSSWMGFFVPAGTPAHIVKRLSDEMDLVMQDLDMQQKIVEMGAIPLHANSQELDKLISDDSQRWSEVLKRVTIDSN